MSSRPRRTHLSSEIGDKLFIDSNDDKVFSWRDSKPDSKPSIRSKGISPKSFYGNRRQ